QGQARGFAVVLQDRAIDHAEEPLRVAVGLVCLATVAVMHAHAAAADTSVGGDGLVRLRQFTTQRCCDRARNLRNQIELVESVSIALEQLDLVETQAKDLETIDRLQKASQRLGMETVSSDRQCSDRLR